MTNIVDLDTLGVLNHSLNRNFNPQIRDVWVAQKAKEIQPNSKVLDVAAGNKPYQHLFNHVQYFSHEFQGNEEICDSFRGETEKSAHDYTGDITDIKAPSAEFDIVICTEVLEHVPEPIAGVGELARLCKPGGKIILTAPFTSGSHQQPYHFYSGFSPEFYEYVAKKYDLEVEEITTQGDFFKLMCYFTNTALYFGVAGTNPETLLKIRHYLESYYLTASEIYGQTADVARHFTVGWMVVLRKPL